MTCFIVFLSVLQQQVYLNSATFQPPTKFVTNCSLVISIQKGKKSQLLTASVHVPQIIDKWTANLRQLASWNPEPYYYQEGEMSNRVGKQSSYRPWGLRIFSPTALNCKVRGGGWTPALTPGIKAAPLQRPFVAPSLPCFEKQTAHF
jgi:hypothetical protein